ncbi:hypothetical protein IC619_016565, partial [Hazenella sp. IB182353]|nr:hypothetical protein [Polycladospora coralii]
VVKEIHYTQVSLSRANGNGHYSNYLGYRAGGGHQAASPEVQGLVMMVLFAFLDPSPLGEISFLRSGPGLIKSVMKQGLKKDAKKGDLATAKKSTKVAKSSRVPAKYDAKFAATSLLRNGKVSVDNLKSMIPKGTPNTFRPSETIKEGYKYRFDINGQKIEIKWHSPDLNAKQLYPNSNSGNMWTAQIKIGRKLLGQDGGFYRRASDKTHIPLE